MNAQHSSCIVSVCAASYMLRSPAPAQLNLSRSPFTSRNPNKNTININSQTVHELLSDVFIEMEIIAEA